MILGPPTSPPFQYFVGLSSETGASPMEESPSPKHASPPPLKPTSKRSKDSLRRTITLCSIEHKPIVLDQSPNSATLRTSKASLVDKENIVDRILASLGDIGPYQWRVYLLSCLPVIITGSMTNSLFFITQAPDHRCYVDGCDQTEGDWNGTNIFNQSFLEFTIPRDSHKSPGSNESNWDQCSQYGRRSSAFSDTCDAGSFNVNSTFDCGGHYLYDHKYFHTTLSMDVSIQSETTSRKGVH